MFVQPTTGELHCKIAYVGPEGAGKATNLRHIHARLRPEMKGRLYCLGEGPFSLLFFDFAPRTVPALHGLAVRLHLYACRKSLRDVDGAYELRGADALVFVADARADRLDAAAELLAELVAHLAREGRRWPSIPHVLQYNKRDLPDALPVAELDARLNPHGAASVAAVAVRGEGVFDTLRAVTDALIERIAASPLP